MTMGINHNTILALKNTISVLKADIAKLKKENNLLKREIKSNKSMKGIPPLHKKITGHTEIKRLPIPRPLFIKGAPGIIPKTNKLKDDTTSH